MLFPELVESPVVLTNAKGVFSSSLAEYVIGACLWFAKDFPRMRASQQAKKWDHYQVDELRGRTMGIVGLGDIGSSAAVLARAFGMKLIGMGSGKSTRNTTIVVCT